MVAESASVDNNKVATASERQPLVTIGIPTYNRADGYLRQAIDSALGQTYEKIEIVVSDNCSSDGTEALVGSIGAPNLRYFRHETNIGANNNFNFLLHQAKGDYFLLLHDDDLVDTDFVEACMKATEPSYDTGIVRTGTRIVDATGRVIRERPNRACGLSSDNFFLAWFRHRTALYLCSTLFHTKRLREVGGFKSKNNLFQDAMAEVQLAARWGQVGIPGVKASFRSDRSKMTHSARVADWCDDSLELLDVICDLATEDKVKIRREGLRFFAKLNYGFAKSVKSPLNRALAFLVVYHKFNYRRFPPPIHRFLVRTPVYRLVRSQRQR